MSKSFVEGIKTPYAASVKSYKVTSKTGEEKDYNYLSWALALALADNPSQELVENGGTMFIPVFGGCVIGIRQKVGDTGPEQITWMPVLNKANQAMPEARVTCRDMNDHMNRCRAKSVAMVNGVGLALYAKGETNALAFLKSTKIKPGDDLRMADAHASTADEKNGAFLDWPHAIAAARITDPEFVWEVLFYDVVDKTTGEISRRPYYNWGSVGYGVAVKVTYKGVSHTEYSPVSGFMEVQTARGPKMLDHQPLPNPNCHDWNRCVMRCLSKAIAMRTGYGQTLYAKVDDVADLHVEPLQKKPPVEAVPEAPDDPKEKADLITKIDAALKATHRPAKSLLEWLGHKDTSDLTVASVAQLKQAMTALSPRKAVA